MTLGIFPSVIGGGHLVHFAREVYRFLGQGRKFKVVCVVEVILIAQRLSSVGGDSHRPVFPRTEPVGTRMAGERDVDDKEDARALERAQSMTAVRGTKHSGSTACRRRLRATASFR